ncbi:hypothetical protein ACEV76_23675 [Vibrio parahaemolyticus]|uniref:hypothetical protein n=1 Tax=Vibrio harveyi group TaxID=717610 RepID=UPI000A39A652|nr:hypothetical protein [Vibrio parahaemolyticus]EJR0682680.1 hypothetical protein [Vibrio parahaemolyticus]MDF4711365.1 hypothetical protein [Vibrio parahaemolyticus]OUJ52037.1 hypothetical protein BTO03_24860 [Vibrio parahaemolyticus]TOA31445.1 hypothetical protein CGK28_24020 [Vibrio parahaemolyticus]
MFKFLIGCVIGFFVSFVSLVLFLVSDTKFDMSVVTNLIIAAATVMATIIHFSSIRQQRKDRLWDINKPILLGLSKSLSAVIKASEYYLQEEYARQHIDDAPDPNEQPDPSVYKEFDQKREYALEVYKVLMDKELIDALEKAKRINDNIDHGVHEHGVDHISAYEASISANEDLQKKLSFFIAKTSGVQDI